MDLAAGAGVEPGDRGIAEQPQAQSRVVAVAVGNDEAAVSDENEAIRLQQSLARGEGHVFVQMFQRYHNSMSRVAAAFVGRNPALVDEVVQDAWMAAFQGVGAFENRCNFRTWLFSILTNRAKTTGERERRTKPFSSLSDDAESGQNAAEALMHGRQQEQNGVDHPQEGARDPESALLHHELSQRLIAALERLPHNYQAILTLRDIEGVSAKEACLMLDVSPENQRVLLFRARNRLREILLVDAAAPRA